MTWESALALSAALFVFCAAPGPGVFAVTARSLASGFRPGLFLALGMVLGDITYFLVAVLGLAAIGQVLGEFMHILRLAGAAYLVWLGVQAWRHADAASCNMARPVGGGARMFATGLGICLGNPKVILFYLGFLPAFMNLADLRATDIVLVTLLVAANVGLVLILYAGFAARARGLFRNPRTLRNLHRGSGVMLVGAGLAVAATD